MNTSRLMIVMADARWTQAALHLACAMSRREQAELLLLKMLPVRHPLLLGTAGGSLSFTAVDARLLELMAMTAEDYGIPLEIRRCQYANYWNAVVDAAGQFSVTAVLIQIPPSPIPYWSKYRRWWLHRQLARQRQHLLTLDDLAPSLTYTPTITLSDDIATLFDH
ncbi:MAG TPA: hypothetical protein PLD25_30675 [Chloroflexota bacterium]|nr:hypothetical protein [Chloroflexota bacterium]